MEKSNWRLTVLILRLVTLAFLVVALIVLATNTVKVSDDEKFTFSNARAYRYVLAVEVIGIAYVLLHIPLAVLSVSQGSFGGNLRIWFLQAADTLLALLFATGVGAALGLTVDLEKEIDDSGLEALVPAFNKFLKLIYVSAAFLLMATITTASTALALAYYVALK